MKHIIALQFQYFFPLLIMSFNQVLLIVFSFYLYLLQSPLSFSQDLHRWRWTNRACVQYVLSLSAGKILYVHRFLKSLYVFIHISFLLLLSFAFVVRTNNTSFPTFVNFVQFSFNNFHRFMFGAIKIENKKQKRKQHQHQNCKKEKSY